MKIIVQQFLGGLGPLHPANRGAAAPRAPLLPTAMFQVYAKTPRILIRQFGKQIMHMVCHNKHLFAGTEGNGVFCGRETVRRG